MANRLVIKSMSNNEFVDDVEQLFRTPLKERGMKLICYHCPPNIKYSVEFPFVLTVTASVVATVLANYLIRLISFIVSKRRRYTKRSILLVIVHQNIEQRFVLPKAAPEAKRYVRKISSSPPKQRCGKKTSDAERRLHTHVTNRHS